MSNALRIDSTQVSDQGENPLEKYRSRPKQLARWLLMSRDALREKYQGLKVQLKRLKVRINDVTKSRDNWRQQAEASQLQVQAMKTEVERLTAILEQASDSESLQKKVNSCPAH
jgi:chromosome segregation ATPase